MQPFKMTLAAALAAICVAAGPSAAVSSEADGAGCTGASVREMRVHSHNDYAQKRPFWGAYEAGADSIEADVFLEGGELLVAHSRKELKKENTLRRLYLEPLRTVFRKNGGRVRANGKPLQLVIDLKSGKPALDALLAMIEREGFRECFDIAKNPSAARLSVGGDISEIKDFLSYPDYVFFSVPSSRKMDDGQYRRVSWISDYARIYTKWRSGAMAEDDKKKIRDAAAQAHAKGVPYRLWGFPDHAEAWRLSRELGLDYLDTDHPDAVAAFLASSPCAPALKVVSVALEKPLRYEKRNGRLEVRSLITLSKAPEGPVSFALDGKPLVCEAGAAPAPIVFDTPAADEKGMMVLGNGEVGAMAWLDAAGTLHTVLQNSDSWNEGGRHVKTGAVDYETKSPVDEGTYRQELSMERGEFEASWKSGGREVSLRYRIQHGTDSIAVCDVKGAPDVEAKVVNWRLYPGGEKEFASSKQYGASGLGNQFDGATENGKPITFTINADRLVPGGWCHVNRNETVAKMMKYYDYYQATGDLGKPDLLSNRVFGGVTRKYCGAARRDASPHHVARPTLFLTAITCLHPCKDEAEWLRRTNEMLDRDGWTIDGEEAKRAAHIAAWRAFWERSHIDVTPSDAAKNKPRKPYVLPTNDKLPLSLGVDSKGGNRFLGTFASAEVELDGKVLYSGVPKAGDVIGRTSFQPHAKSAKSAKDSADEKLCGIGELRIFRFACTFSTDRFEKPQRLLDNVTPGKGDGFLVDVLNGQIRLVAGKNWFTHPTKLRAGRKTAIEVVVSQSGAAKIVVNGVAMESNFGSASVADECAAITLRYAAQRYLNGCTGRGRLPIRFNGSLFTMTHKGDPDYRQWGHGYWWQNTRLPYYTMFASGDLDMLQPLFNMYCGLIDFNMKRTRKYLGHGGAYFPECMQPWGDHFLSVYSANRFLQYEKGAWKDRTDKLQLSGWHKYEWVGQLELSLMLLRYYAFTQDDAWFKTKALPSVREYVRYFDEHYTLDANGRYLMHPAQATEMWWNCTNPMPEIAGLTCVTEMLLALPKGVLSEDDRALFAKIRARIPELPTRKLCGMVAFAPADKFASRHNLETPELYCVFPFRLCSFEKPNVEIGRHSYREGRIYKLYHGWAQDEVNAAYLGMTEEARKHIADRALTHSKKIYRWPAYWGPNFNWCPDQDEGGIFLITIQSMLMQYEGDKIFLLPAWPKDWNCDFKLYAPKNTVIQGHVENGELKDLVVTPASRRKDVQINAVH